MSNSLFKASKNLGIFKELSLLLDYIEDNDDLNLLDYLLVNFKSTGLTHIELKDAIELIEDYLPNYLECDSKGCYLTQEIDGIPAYTYIDNIDVEASEVTVSNNLLVTAR